MGRAKGLLEFGGVPLIARIARAVEPIAERTVIVGSPEIYAGLGLTAIPDHDFGIAKDVGRSGGPLFGIATALSQSRAPRCLILACDLPYLTTEWARWFVGRAMRSAVQAVAPLSGEKLEPLAAIYRTECASVAKRLIEQGARSATALLNELEVERVPESEWKAVGFSATVLKNINTPHDYQEALGLWDSNEVESYKS